MKLTVLGCAGTFPGPESPCSGYLIEHDGYRLVVDMGAGSLGVLQRFCDLLDVNAVYLSHLHADHCLDLIGYSYARRFHPKGLPPRLPVYGPAGSAARLCAAFEAPPAGGLRDLFDFREQQAGNLTLGPLELTTAVTNHPVECHAMRITAGGRVLTYTGDTDVSDAVVELARDADLFLCEATWESTPVQPAGIHLNGRTAGEHAARAGAKKLLLTHLSAFSDPDVIVAEARSTYDGPIELARSGHSWEV